MPPLWLFSKPSFSIILGMSSKTGMENFFFLRTVFQTLPGIPEILLTLNQVINV